MKLTSLLRLLPAVALAATIGTAAAKPKVKPSPSPAAATSDATPAASPDDTATSTTGTAAGKKRTMSPDAIKKGQLTRLRNEVGLKPDQETKVKPIVDKYVDDRLAVKNDASLSSTAKEAKFKDLRQQYVASINGVLTPDQQKQWAAAKTARVAKMRAGRAKAQAGAAAQPSPAVH
ncbi:MAG TPA: hypothetical protein VGD78_11800 [Chthoniobacterales bacterium]